MPSGDTQSATEHVDGVQYIAIWKFAESEPTAFGNNVVADEHFKDLKTQMIGAS